MTQTYRAGDSLEDLCRVCKTVRGHTVIVADGEGRALRVICDYCGSQHNFRGGHGGDDAPAQPPRHSGATTVALVTERERRYPVMNVTAQDGGAIDLELLLRRIIREETGITPVPMADKWRGGRNDPPAWQA